MQKRHRAFMTGIGFLLTVAAVVGLGAIAVVLWPMLVHIPTATTTAKAVAAPLG